MQWLPTSNATFRSGATKTNAAKQSSCAPRMTVAGRSANDAPGDCHVEERGRASSSALRHVRFVGANHRRRGVAQQVCYKILLRCNAARKTKDELALIATQSRSLVPIVPFVQLLFETHGAPHALVERNRAHQRARERAHQRATVGRTAAIGETRQVPHGKQVYTRRVMPSASLGDSSMTATGSEKCVTNGENRVSDGVGEHTHTNS